MCSSTADSLSRTVYIYIQSHTQCHRCVSAYVRKIYALTYAFVWNDRTHEPRQATKQSRITVFKGRIVAICRHNRNINLRYTALTATQIVASNNNYCLPSSEPSSSAPFPLRVELEESVQLRQSLYAPRLLFEKIESDMLAYCNVAILDLWWQIIIIIIVTIIRVSWHGYVIASYDRSRCCRRNFFIFT